MTLSWDVIVECASHLGRLTESIGGILQSGWCSAAERPQATSRWQNVKASRKISDAWSHKEQRVCVGKVQFLRHRGAPQQWAEWKRQLGPKKTVAFKTRLPIMHQRPECVGACCFQNTHSDISLGFWVAEGSKAQRNSMQTAQSGKQWQKGYAEKQANVCNSYNSNLKLEIK